MEVFPAELRAELWSEDVSVRSAAELLGPPGRGIKAGAGSNTNPEYRRMQGPKALFRATPT